MSWVWSLLDTEYNVGYAGWKKCGTPIKKINELSTDCLKDEQIWFVPACKRLYLRSGEPKELPERLEVNGKPDARWQFQSKIQFKKVISNEIC